MSTQLLTWTENAFSWLDRIKISRSFVLSKFLFLFWMLPIYLEVDILVQWQKALDSFVWANKWTRLMYPQKERGALGLLVLKQYYLAANLVSVLKMFDLMARDSCLTIQNLVASPSSLADLVWSIHKQHSFQDKNYLFLYSSLQIWDTVYSCLTSVSCWCLPIDFTSSFPRQKSLGPSNLGGTQG